MIQVCKKSILLSLFVLIGSIFSARIYGSDLAETATPPHYLTCPHIVAFLGEAKQAQALGDYERAADAIVSILASAEPHRWTIDEAMAVHLSLASAYEKLGKYSVQYEVFSQMLVKFSSMSDRNRAQIELHMGVASLRMKKFIEAKGHFERAKQLSPSNELDIDSHLGVLYMTWAQSFRSQSSSAALFITYARDHFTAAYALAADPAKKAIIVRALDQLDLPQTSRSTRPLN